ncbi:MAG: hypothetical protein V1875_04850 [Candidatus Altiarchaeota archaeon]
MRIAQTLILAVILASACLDQAQTGPVCNRPYILVGSGCCLDDNSDGVCDKDKPICQKPHILVGGQCCPDANENSVCDKDEQPTTTASATTLTVTTVTTATTTSATTSTIVSDRACNRVEDCPSYEQIKCDDDKRVVNDSYGPIMCSKGVCIYKATRDIGAVHCYDWEVCVNNVGCVRKEDTTTTTTSSTVTSSTETTIPKLIQEIFDRIAKRERESAASVVTSTTLPATCFDADGGMKEFIWSGNVTGRFEYNGTFLYDSREYCQSGQNLLEFYCLSGLVQGKVITCENSCIGGKCCVPEGRLCEGDKDCCRGSCQSVGLEQHCVG